MNEPTGPLSEVEPNAKVARRLRPKSLRGRITIVVIIWLFAACFTYFAIAGHDLPDWDRGAAVFSLLGAVFVTVDLFKPAKRE